MPWAWFGTWRWVWPASHRKGGPQEITLVPLKAAATVVYDTAKPEIEPGVLAGIEAALVDGTTATIAKLKSEDPKPSAIHQAFHRFCRTLIDMGPEKNPSEPLVVQGRMIVEIMTWLGQAPSRSFQDGFFRQMTGRREVQELGGIHFVRNVLKRIKRYVTHDLRIGSQRVETTRFRKPRPRKPSDKRTVYFIERCPPAG